MPGRDHPSVQVHDPHQFDPVKTGLDCAAALYWKRRDIRHQARSRSCMPFAGGSFVWSLRSSISSAMRLRICSRSEEHTSELQSLMRISYAVFCLKKKNEVI